MAADKGFAACSLLAPDEDERRRAGTGVTFLAASTGAAAGLAAADFAAGFFTFFSGAGTEARTASLALALLGAGLAAGFFSAATGLGLAEAATAF